MLGEEERREKKKRRKRSRKSKTKEDATEEHGDDGAPLSETPHEDEEKQEETPKGESGEHKLKRKRKRKRKSKQAASTEDARTEEQGNDTNAKKLTSLDLTAYIEGIPFECSEEDVKNFFVTNGCEDILQLRLPR